MIKKYSFIKHAFNFLIAIMLIQAVACKSDTAPNTAEAEAQTSQVDAHAGHDHDHDHSGHNHASNDKPKAVENNSRVTVPVEPSGRSKDGPLLNGKEILEKKNDPKAEKGLKQNVYIKLPDACTLMTESFIGKTVGVNADQITLKDGSSKSSPYSRSCFFRWEHRGVPNSGVLVQVQSNPVPDEFPEWAPYYIQAKRNQGERSPDGSLSYSYKKLEGLGVDGAYSYELHRYIWRDADDMVYMVAFNLPASEADELEWARKIGKEFMANAQDVL